jgi:hypothetical protein
VADALSRKATCHQMKIEEVPKEILQDLGKEGILMVINSDGATKAALEMQSNLQEEIKRRQPEDRFITEEIQRITIGQPSEFTRAKDGSLWYKRRICVLDIPEIKKLILQEAHQTP